MNVVKWCVCVFGTIFGLAMIRQGEVWQGVFLLAAAIFFPTLVGTIQLMQKWDDERRERESRYEHETNLKRMELDNQQLIELRKAEAERQQREAQHAAERGTEVGGRNAGDLRAEAGTQPGG